MNKFEMPPPESVEDNAAPAEVSEVSRGERARWQETEWKRRVEASKEKARSLMSSVAELEGSFTGFPPSESIGINMVGDSYELSAPKEVDADSMERLQDLYNQLNKVLVPAVGENMGTHYGHPLAFAIYHEAQHLTPRMLFEKIKAGLQTAEEFEG